MAKPRRHLWLLFVALALSSCTGCETGCQEPHSTKVASKEKDALQYRLSPPGPATADWKIVFDDAPSFLHALKMAPGTRESELNRGTWLVLACGVWSQNDMNSIKTAFNVVKTYRGRIQLAVRPFDKYEEMATWLPEYVEAGSTKSPVVVILENGKVKAWQAGQFSDAELKKLTEKVGKVRR